MKTTDRARSRPARDAAVRHIATVLGCVACLYAAGVAALPAGATRETVIDVSAAYGIRPGETDNAARLIAMRDDLRAGDADTHWVLEFPPSADPYSYSNNRWLNGLKYVTVRGEGARLRNISGLAGGQDTRPFDGRGITQDWDDRSFTGQRHRYYEGIRLTGPAQAGSRWLALADTTSLAAGDALLVAGFSQQRNGYPFNARYFEFAEIASLGDGGVRLAQPLRNSYRMDWWDDNYGAYRFGKPRAYQLSRPGYQYPEYLAFEGLEFVENPNSPNNDPLVVSARTVLIDGVKGRFDDFFVFVRETEHFTIRNSVIGGLIEVDKQVWDARIEDNVVHGGIGRKWPHAIKAGTSCELLLIKGNRIDNRVNVVCNNLYIESNRIDHGDAGGPRRPVIAFYNNSYGGTLAAIRNNDIVTAPRQPAIGDDLICLDGGMTERDGILRVHAKDVNSRLMGLRSGAELYDRGRAPVGVLRDMREHDASSIELLVDWLDKPVPDGGLCFHAFRQRVLENNRVTVSG